MVGFAQIYRVLYYKGIPEIESAVEYRGMSGKIKLIFASMPVASTFPHTVTVSPSIEVWSWDVMLMVIHSGPTHRKFIVQSIQVHAARNH